MGLHVLMQLLSHVVAGLCKSILNARMKRSSISEWFSVGLWWAQQIQQGVGFKENREGGWEGAFAILITSSRLLSLLTGRAIFWAWKILKGALWPEGSALEKTWFINCSYSPNESFCNSIFSESILPLRPPLQYQMIASYFESYVKLILLIITLHTK